MMRGMSVEVVPATADRWQALEKVMATPGDPSACWCQVFRHPREDWDARSVAQNRADLQALVTGGRTPGLVAVDGDEPVGWVSVAPLSEMARLADSAWLAEARAEDEDLSGRWVVTCFVVRESARGSGLLARLLEAAVEHAREAGATALEAFPLDTSEAPEVDPDTLFAGTLEEYLRQGFVVRGALQGHRVLVVRDL